MEGGKRKREREKGRGERERKLERRAGHSASRRPSELGEKAERRGFWEEKGGVCGAKAEGRVDNSREIQTDDGRCGMGMIEDEDEDEEGCWMGDGIACPGGRRTGQSQSSDKNSLIIAKE